LFWGKGEIHEIASVKFFSNYTRWKMTAPVHAQPVTAPVK